MGEREVALVTGGGRGIGRATAIRLAREGFHVVLTGTNWEEMSHVEGEIREFGGEVESIPSDLSDAQSLDHLGARISEQFPQIDLLVHCHNLLIPGPLSELPLEKWNESLGMNLTGPFLLNQLMLRRMGPGAHIFHIASITGAIPMMNWGALCASKGGLVSYANVLREELRPRGIHVTTLIPSTPHTPLFDEAPGEWKASQVACPESVAEMVTTLYKLRGNMVTEQVTLMPK